MQEIMKTTKNNRLAQCLNVVLAPGSLLFSVIQPTSYLAGASGEMFLFQKEMHASFA